jgi:hypothetical protein
MNCTHEGRDLLDKHLLVIAAAESQGFPEIAAQANEVWSLHEIILDALTEYLAQVTE